jgi:hypothetical protein
MPTFTLNEQNLASLGLLKFGEGKDIDGFAECMLSIILDLLVPEIMIPLINA